jgi:hypothetical protein
VYTHLHIYPADPDDRSMQSYVRVRTHAVFKYNTTWHDVAWVSKGGYRNCIVSPKGRAPVYHTGYDAVTLPRGTHYFICAMPGHCSAGMKLAVTVY